MQAYLDKIITSGMGLWSDVIKEVKTTGYTVDANQHFDFGELRVYFDTSTWDVENDGLIYTDEAFLESVRVAFGTSDIHYSEQGMQGTDFVSFDVGFDFLRNYEGA